MNGRALSAILLLLVLLAVGLVSTPALSGEHPWDSDITGTDETAAADKPGDAAVSDTTTDVVETEDVNDDGTDGTAFVAPTPSSSVSLSSMVYGLFTVLSIGL